MRFSVASRRASVSASERVSFCLSGFGMNTPRSKKSRYTDPPESVVKDGDIYAGVIADKQAKQEFADIITGYVFLEKRMSSVLAALIGDADIEAAAHINAAIVSPSGRLKVMQALLQKSYINKDLESEYDAIISEFDSISKLRNRYVHALWFTRLKSGASGKFENDRLLIDNSGIAGESLCDVQEISPAEFTALKERIQVLHGRIREGPEKLLAQRLRERSPLSK